MLPFKLVYHERYDLNLGPHVFPSQKFRLIHEMLVTDRPTLYAPDLPAVADFQQIRAFELLSKGQALGALPVSTTPMAIFTSEGGFRAAGDVAWTPLTEEELMDRLEKLMANSADEQNVCSKS